MDKAFMGIDISKLTLDVTILTGDKEIYFKTTNDELGFMQILESMGDSTSNYHVCMESSGIYTLGIANFLYDNNIKVSVVNPRRVTGYAISILNYQKTDRIDSKLIAGFCKLYNPPKWQPLSKEMQFIYDKVRRIEQLTDMKNYRD